MRTVLWFDLLAFALAQYLVEDDSKVPVARSVLEERGALDVYVNQEFYGRLEL